ncbi:MAG: Gfo/Idh/MocA family protein [Verrucomicrobiales bacterium]
MKNTQRPFSRRHFLKVSGASALALPLAGRSVLGANNTVRIGLLGCGGRAATLGSQFSKAADSEVVVICDPDTAQMEALVAKLKKKDVDLSKAERVQDYRKVLERDDIDAIVIAAPNFWHTLMAIQAMESGKDVYVEKPVSHSLWEGQQLVAAQKKYGRVIAAGFQNRSDPGPLEGIQYVQEGNLGKILSVQVVCFRNRSSIGKQDAALTPPSTIDYNLWLGPCQDQPMHRPQFHYDWHWVWNSGNGDVGNQAPHEIDLACWVLGDKPLPAEMNSFGGRFGWNDAGETPNMMASWCDHNGTPLLIEVNDMWLAPERNVSPARNSIRVGIIVKCEGGELRGGRGGMYSVAEDGKSKLEKFPGNGGMDHQENFLAVVRSRRHQDLRSNIVAAERSSAVAHLANISYLSGSAGEGKAVNDHIGDNAMLQTIRQEQARQLKAWGIDTPSYTLGKKLAIDPATATVKTPGADPRLIKRDYREPFVVPQLA